MTENDEKQIGYVLNFGASLIKHGIKRIVNGLEDENLGVFGSLREPTNLTRRETSEPN